MRAALDIAFEKLGLKSYGHLLSWQKAEKVLENFNVPVLDEWLALMVLCEIICFVHFPNEVLLRANVQRAEEKIPELLDVNPDHEFHMDEVEVIYDQLMCGKSPEEIGRLYCRSHKVN